MVFGWNSGIAKENEPKKLNKNSKKYAEKLEDIKKKIAEEHSANAENIDRFHNAQKYAYKTTISPSQLAVLDALDKPALEFPIIVAPLSRLCGEFAENQPSIYASADKKYGVDVEQLEVVEGHIRHILWDAILENTQYNGRRDQLSGGMGVFKLYTEYENETSFNQIIKFCSADSPTLIGFDPSSKKSTKSDAEWYYEIFPMTKARFEAEFPEVDISNIKYEPLMQGATSLSWAYSNAGNKIILVAHFYEKKRERKTIYELSNGQSVTNEQYDEIKSNWDKEGHLEQLPIKTGQSRETTISFFVRYRLIGSQIFDKKDTDFRIPSYVFIDGNSIRLTKGGNSTYEQYTRPYIKDLMGVQDMVNLAGQAIADDIQSMVMHKFMIPIEGIPDQEELQAPLEDYQKASLMVYKAYDIDPVTGERHQIPAPTPVSRVPLPSSVMESFNMGFQMMQNILGSSDAQLGAQNNQLSGRAIENAAIQSNSTSKPYDVNYMQALNQVAQGIAYLIPKLYVTARTIPIIDKNGNRGTADINQDGSVSMDYEPDAIKVRLEAGINFKLEKNRAMQQITNLMSASPAFAQFMGGLDGLPILVDNLDIEGKDILKEKVDQFVEQMKQQQAQQANQPSPDQMKLQLQQQDLQLKQQKLQQDGQIAAADIHLKQQKMQEDSMNAQADREIEQLKAVANITMADDSLEATAEKVAAEKERTETEQEVAFSKEMREAQDQEHRHLVDIIELARSAAPKESEKLPTSKPLKS